MNPGISKSNLFITKQSYGFNSIERNNYLNNIIQNYTIGDTLGETSTVPPTSSSVLEAQPGPQVISCTEPELFSILLTAPTGAV